MGAVALLLLAAAAGPLAAIISTAPDAPKAAVTDGLQAQAATSTLPLDVEAIKADPASAGKALAEAAAADAATVGALLVSAAKSDPRATADVLNVGRAARPRRQSARPWRPVRRKIPTRWPPSASSCR